MKQCHFIVYLIFLRGFQFDNSVVAHKAGGTCDRVPQPVRVAVLALVRDDVFHKLLERGEARHASLLIILQLGTSEDPWNVRLCLVATSPQYSVAKCR